MTLQTPQFQQSPDTTEADCQAFVREWHEFGKVNNFQTMEPDEFWSANDLDRFNQTVAWWPKDAPPVVSCPYLPSLLRGCATPVGSPPPDTFTNLLTQQWFKCYQWLVAEGRNPDNPNETSEERARRKARERVARSRARQANEGNDKVKELYDAYIAACQVRKAAVDAAHAAHTPAVMEAHAAWAAAKG